ncbi:putative transposase [Microcystis aeruginosa NIES-3804]|uniref:Putative transposase n=1 Tax=Microcystis aeruginosa NIES-3804 TaxID=2517783 RepID=A0A6H9GYL9_MICAE|nr:putative transposase [Microcystis aeruginosa NIES-3804]
MALATYSIVAWRLLWLTYQARLHGGSISFMQVSHYTCP